jgi:hypothetical protein
MPRLPHVDEALLRCVAEFLVSCSKRGSAEWLPPLAEVPDVALYLDPHIGLEYLVVRTTVYTSRR